MIICFDWKYQKWTSEEVYEDLYKQAEEDGRIINEATLDVHLDMDDSQDDKGSGGNPTGEDGEGGNKPGKGPEKIYC